MAQSTVLIEREGKSVIDNLTSRLVCTRRKEGSFSLQLRETGGLGRLRHTVARRIRCPKEFVNALFSMTRWSDLSLQDHEIADEVCTQLRNLDAEFADAVEEDVFFRRLALHLQDGKRTKSAVGGTALTG